MLVRGTRGCLEHTWQSGTYMTVWDIHVKLEHTCQYITHMVVWNTHGILENTWCFGTHMVVWNKQAQTQRLAWGYLWKHLLAICSSLGFLDTPHFSPWLMWRNDFLWCDTTIGLKHNKLQRENCLNFLLLLSLKNGNVLSRSIVFWCQLLLQCSAL